VGFRHFIKINARELEVYGWARNLPDGRVEAVFEGEVEKVQALIKRCQNGPRAGYVQNMEITDGKEKGAYTQFEIRL
jgi:acylphosphatase